MSAVTQSTRHGESQGAKEREVVLYVGEKAEAFSSVISLLHMLKQEFPTDRNVLLSLVNGVKHVGVEYASVYKIMKVVGEDGSSKALVRYDPLSNRVTALTALAEDELRRLLGDIVKALYNYLFVLNAYYGRADWANDRRNVLRAVAYSSDEERLVTAFPELSVLDSDLVSKIVYVFSNLHITVKLPPGAVDEKEFIERIVEVDSGFIGDSCWIDEYYADVLYYPDVYVLELTLLPPHRDQQSWIATVFVEALSDSVRFKIVTGKLLRYSDIEWVIENRCSIVMEGISALEHRYRGKRKLLENIGFFRKAIEAVCAEIASKDAR
ncbi:MAG: hypothetical protein QXU26_03320 [Thermofilaceae archaeon]